MDRVAEVEYRDIPGWLGYRAGSDGTIWSRWRRRGRGIGRGKGSETYLSDGWHKLRPAFYSGKYQQVVLCIDGRQITRKVHHLVLEAFDRPCPWGMECCHNDGNPSNNCLRNLRWDTSKNNNADKHQHGTVNHGTRNGMAKLTEEGARDAKRRLRNGESRRSIAARLNVSIAAIGKIARNQGWQHIGI